MSAIPEPIRLGDDVTLYCADCLDVLPTLEDDSIDLILTDPPYGIREIRGDNSSRSVCGTARDYGTLEWDSERADAATVVHCLRIGIELVIFGGNYYADLLPPSSSWIVWNKDNGQNPFADVELAWTSHNRAARIIRHRWQGMLQEHGGRWKEDRVHPTQKPVGVMLWILENYSEPGDTILDPFMGSGTTGVAAVKMGRKFIGIERETKYFDIAKRRIEEAKNHLFAEVSA